MIRLFFIFHEHFRLCFIYCLTFAVNSELWFDSIEGVSFHKINLCHTWFIFSTFSQPLFHLWSTLRWIFFFSWTQKMCFEFFFFFLLTMRHTHSADLLFEYLRFHRVIQGQDSLPCNFWLLTILTFDNFDLCLLTILTIWQSTETETGTGIVYRHFTI